MDKTELLLLLSLSILISYIIYLNKKLSKQNSIINQKNAENKSLREENKTISLANKKLNFKYNEIEQLLNEKHKLYIGLKDIKQNIEHQDIVIKQKIEKLLKDDRLSLLNNEFKKEFFEVKQILDGKYQFYTKSQDDELINELSVNNSSEIKKRTSKFYSDYVLSQYIISQKYLENKYKPARNEVKRISELREKTEDILIKSRQIQYRNEELKKALSEKDNLLEVFFEKSNNSISKIASLYSDYLLLQFKISENVLREKDRPALVEVERIQELQKRSKIYVQQYKEMLYRYESLLLLFPELNDYVEDFSDLSDLESFKNIENLEEDFDRTKFYIDNESYSSLSEIERNQLALDNYIKNSKTNWQIGRDYELFCGQYYENMGWDVSYFGMEKKLNDLGRDLIAKKDNEKHIIQCKYWSQHKLIHEKHILQLYGTTIFEQFENQDLFTKIVPVFMTNIELSETAMKFAKILNVKVIKLDMTEFPRIKCNTNTDSNGNKTKIYHLPFDQQYDRTQIKNADEFYTLTVKEAVEKGFRRAYKYRGP